MIQDQQSKIGRQNFAAGCLLLFTQLLYSFMYGFFINIKEFQVGSSQQFVHTLFLMLLVIVGFSLALLKSPKLLWSSLGFNLLITVLSIQTYFLMNAFCTKAGVFFGGSSQFNSNPYKITLIPGQQEQNYVIPNFNESIKCALSCIVAFSFVIGRVGLFELYFISVFGSIAYQLARTACLNIFLYEVGSIKIFLFGGSLGLMYSLILVKIKNQQDTANHRNKQSIELIEPLKIVGLLICWALFPLLSRDSINNQVSNTKISRILTIVYAMSSATLCSIMIFYKFRRLQFVIRSNLGAGISVLSSSVYISNPVYAILVGIFSLFIQIMFQLLNEKIQRKYNTQIDNNSFVFFSHGIFGVIYETINRSIVQGNSNLLNYKWQTAMSNQMILGSGATTMAIGLFIGLILCLVLSRCSYHVDQDQFTDDPYWFKKDVEQEKSEKKIRKQEALSQIKMSSKVKGLNSYL